MITALIGLYAATVTAMVLEEPCKNLLHYIQHCKCGVCQSKNRVKEKLC
jgi:hypothetical protein